MSANTTDGADTNSDDYEVGYGRPPKRTRFAKGRSGNRRGRPRNTRNLKTDLRTVLDEGLTLTIAGHEVKLSARRAMMIALRNKALKGDVRAIGMLVTLLERLMPETLIEDVRASVPRDDVAIFAEAIDRHVAMRLAQKPTAATSTTKTQSDGEHP
jgi:hypothetical protein